MKKFFNIFVAIIVLVALTIIGAVCAIQNTPENSDFFTKLNIPFFNFGEYKGSVTGKEVKNTIKKNDSDIAIFVHNYDMGTVAEGNMVVKMDEILAKHPMWVEAAYTQVWNISGLLVPEGSNEDELTSQDITFVNYRALLATAGEFSFDNNEAIFSSGFAYSKNENGLMTNNKLYNNDISGISDRTSPEYISDTAKYKSLDIKGVEGNTIGVIYYQVLH